MTEQEAAIQQVRETLIKSGILFAERLRFLRSQGTNYNIAVSMSGGLAIMLGDDDRYRFGAVFSNRVQAADMALVNRWNRQEPNHPVKLMPIQEALMEECSRIFTLLHELEKNINRTEGGA